MNVSIETLAPQPVAYMRYVGPYGPGGIPQLWGRFDAWIRSRGLDQPRRRGWGLSHDNPEVTAPELCRYDACIDVDERFQGSGEVGLQTLAGGLYACTEFKGTAETIPQAWMQLFSQWLPQSPWQADDRGCLELYPADMQMDPATGEFSCRLCLPVRAA